MIRHILFTTTVLAASASLADASNMQRQWQAAQPYFAPKSPSKVYVPPPPSPLSTLAPPAERSHGNYRSLATSGNGCGGFGVVAIDEIEKIAKEMNETGPRNDLERLRPLGVFRDRLDERMNALQKEYMRLYSPYDTRDIFILNTVDNRTFMPNLDMKNLDNKEFTVAPFMPNKNKIDEKTIRDCLPNFSKLIDNFMARTEKAKQRDIEAAREAAKPQNRAFRAYNLYVRVKFCNETRQGYLVQYVNDVEMDRATIAVKAVVREAQKEEPDMDTNPIWEKARQAASGSIASDSYCRMYLGQLLKMSPVDTYGIQKP
jgi:hypothetical protein